MAFKYLKLTNMPKRHMNLVIPFKFMGIDFTGHPWAKHEYDNKSTKIYILIFTCLNVRAIHLELLPDMTAKNFLLAFERFCNIFVTPSYVYSDTLKILIVKKFSKML